MQDSDEDATIAAALGCPPGAAQALRLAGRLRHLAAAEPLAQQGDRVAEAWLILDGAVRCEVVSPDGRVSIATTHPPGDLIGQWGSSAGALPGTLVAAQPTMLLALPAGTLDRIGAGDAGLALALARCFARQADQLLHRLAARNSLTAAGRLCARLLEMADDALAVRPCPTVSALAVMVQTTRETASRTISVLERRGIIARHADRLQIQSRRLLEDQIV